jgi:PBP1b-binding outer membrane lipoprotein LpoB
MVPVMLKSKLLSLLLASSALVFAGCVSEPDDEVGSDELAAIESEIENLDPVPLCPDLNDVYFEVPQSCTRDGQLGSRSATRPATSIAPSRSPRPGRPARS